MCQDICKVYFLDTKRKGEPMERFRAFLRRKNIVFSAKRYGVDALGAMAQGLFCTLLVGTILDTLGVRGMMVILCTGALWLWHAATSA